MPLSPLTRLLIALTLLAFPWFFMWLEDSSSRVSSTMLGVSLTLLVAAVFMVIRDNPAFDDRAFHRSRPGGDSKAFRRSTGTLLGIVAAVSLMAAARSLFYHLGWKATVASTLIVFTQVGLLTAALATGFTLASHRGGMTRRIAVVMLGLPTALYFLTLEWQSARLWLGPQELMTEWMTGIGLATLVGVVGFGLTWWLTAGRRRWTLALVLAGLTATCLPLLNGRSGRRAAGIEALPVSPATLTRHPVVVVKKPEDPRLSELRKTGDEILPFEGRLSVDGLKDDEFVSIARLGTDQLSPQIALGYQIRGFGGFGGADGILRQSDSTSMTRRRSLLEHLTSRVPGHPELILSEENQATGNWVSFPRYPRENQVIDLEGTLENLTWSIDGRVFQVEDAGSFPLATGGWHRLPAGGTVRVWPVNQSIHGSSIRMRLVISAFDDLVYDRGIDGETAGLPMALIVDESGRRAWLPTVVGGGMPTLDSRNFRLASRWLDWEIRFGESYRSRIPPDEVLRSRLYLFLSRPGARIQASLPPPR